MSKSFDGRASPLWATTSYLAIGTITRRQQAYRLGANGIAANCLPLRPMAACSPKHALAWPDLAARTHRVLPVLIDEPANLRIDPLFEQRIRTLKGLPELRRRPNR